MVIRPFIDKLYDRHLDIRAFTLSLHFEKFWFSFASLLSIVNPKIVNSVSQVSSRVPFLIQLGLQKFSQGCNANH